MSATTMKTVQLDGVKLAYRELGDGPPVLLLHGWPTSSFLWRNVMAPIARANRVVALDLPGFGASDKPLGIRYSFEFFARVLDGFLAQLGIDRLGLGGPRSRRPDRTALDPRAAGPRDEARAAQHARVSRVLGGHEGVRARLPVAGAQGEDHESGRPRVHPARRARRSRDARAPRCSPPCRRRFAPPTLGARSPTPASACPSRASRRSRASCRRSAFPCAWSTAPAIACSPTSRRRWPA